MWPFRRRDAAPTERKSVSHGGYFFAGGLLAPPSATYTRLAKEGYGQNAVAYACANKIAATLASVEWQLFEQGGDGKPERIPDHDILKLIENPNPMQSGMEFRQHLATYFALSGNGFVLGEGMDARGNAIPTGLALLSPGHVQVKPGRYHGMPGRYIYKPGNQEFAYEVDQLTGRSAVLQIKSFNPLDPLHGMSPMLPAALAIDQHNASCQWNYSLLKRGARPSGALLAKGTAEHPGQLTDEQYTRLKQSMEEEYSGEHNAGRPLLLEGNFEWQEMSHSPKDVDFLEGKNSAARDIALAFGVPPMLLGIPGDSTYSNMAEARLALYTDTVLPMLQVILGGFNRWLTPLYGDGLFLWYDPEMIEALEPLRKAKGERINAAAYLKTDEKREAMGYEPLDDDIGQQVLVQSSMIPLELAGAMPDLPEPGSPADGKPKPAPQEEDEEP